MAAETNTASRAGGRSASAPKGFRPAPETKASAAAPPRVAPGQWDPRLLLEQIERELPAASDAKAIFSLLHRLAGLSERNPTRAPFADPADVGEEQHEHWMGRWCSAERSLKQKLASLPAPFSASEMADAVALVIEDQAPLPGRYTSDDDTFAIARRVEAELRAIADGAPHSTGCDAALIAACADYPARMAEVNDGPDEKQDGPIWQRYSACRDVISAGRPVTLAGMLAKARAAKVEAVRSDGSESPENTMAAGWSWDLVNDLLRLFGDVAAPRLPACPSAALIPDLIAAEIEHARISSHTPGRDELADKANKHMTTQVWARKDALWAVLATTRPTSIQGAMLCLLGAANHADDLDMDTYSEEVVSAKAEAIRNLLAGAYYAIEAARGDLGLAVLRDERLGLLRYSLATREEYKAEHERLGVAL